MNTLARRILRGEITGQLLARNGSVLPEVRNNKCQKNGDRKYHSEKRKECRHRAREAKPFKKLNEYIKEVGQGYRSQEGNHRDAADDVQKIEQQEPANCRRDPS